MARQARAFDGEGGDARPPPERVSVHGGSGEWRQIGGGTDWLCGDPAEGFAERNCFHAYRCRDLVENPCQGGVEVQGIGSLIMHARLNLIFAGQGYQMNEVAAGGRFLNGLKIVSLDRFFADFADFADKVVK